MSSKEPRETLRVPAPPTPPGHPEGSPKKRAYLGWPPLILAAVVILGIILVVRTGDRDAVFDYEVTIENLTSGQLFSPPVVATHPGQGVLFEVNGPSSFGLKEIAENGNNRPLLEQLSASRSRGDVFDFQQASPTPLVPAGKPGAAPPNSFPARTTFRIRAERQSNRLSWVSMLVCTNDGFTGSDSVGLPTELGKTLLVSTSGYETRTERNTEILGDIMPPCQGLIGVMSPSRAPGTTQSNPALAEGGVVVPHGGVVGGSELDRTVHGWRDPVAMVKITRVA